MAGGAAWLAVVNGTRLRADANIQWQRRPDRYEWEACSGMRVSTVQVLLVIVVTLSMVSAEAALRTRCD